MPQDIDVDRILKEIVVDGGILAEQFEGMPTDVAIVNALLMIAVALANLKDSLNVIAGNLS